MEILWWKIGFTRTAGKQTFLPQLATFKLSCYQLPLGSELDCCQLGCPYSIHISEVPPLEASVDPLWSNTFIYTYTVLVNPKNQRSYKSLQQKLTPSNIFVGCSGMGVAR